MAFCLPFSTALTLTFSAFGVLFGLVGFDWASLKIVMRHPIAILCVALFAWLALSMLWTIGTPDEMFEALSKYRKLLFVPLIAMLLISTRVRPRSIVKLFLAGCLVVCVGSLLSKFNLLTHLIGEELPTGGWGLGGDIDRPWFHIGPPHSPTFGRAWIAQGAFLALATTYFLAELSDSLQENKSIGVSSLGLVICVLTTSFVNISLGGRTGIVLLAVSAVGWLAIFAVRKQKRLFLCAFAFVFVAAVITIGYESIATSRITSVVKEVTEYQRFGTLTSQGIRLNFWNAALMSWLKYPLIGSGIGSFAESFKVLGQAPQALIDSRPHPHSEFALQLVQGGVVAIFFYVALFSFAIRKAIFNKGIRSKNFQYREFSLGLIIFLMFTNGFFNSVIWDLAEGHVIAIFLALAILPKKEENVEV
ncbi:RfaL Lipid A core - O-antigen ligase and related enzymes [Burkholderiales bacterium]